MTTDAGRADVLAQVAATRLNEARFSLLDAYRQVEHVEMVLDTSMREVRVLNEQAFDLATTSRADGQTGEQFRDQVWDQLDDSRQVAARLEERLQDARRSLLGTMTDYDEVPVSVQEALDTSSRALGDADRALAELQRIPDHDAGVASNLRERADLIGGAVDRSLVRVEDIGARLQSARRDLAAINRDGYLSSDQDPVTLGARIAQVSRDVGSDIGRAQQEMARGEGRLDTVREPAGRAASDSADLAMRKGMNPTPHTDQRPVVASSEQPLRDRSDGGVNKGTERQ